MSDKVPAIEIDMDKRCIKCKRRGASPSGLCLGCAVKEIKRGGLVGLKDTIRRLGAPVLLLALLLPACAMTTPCTWERVVVSWTQVEWRCR